MGLDILFPLVGRATSPIKTINLDDWFDQFNRMFMFYLCLVFAIVITIRQGSAGVIACDGFAEERLEFAEQYCWSQGIYTLQEAYSLDANQSPYPGVVPEDVPACFEYELHGGGKIVCPKEEELKPPKRIYQSWYPFVMFYFWIAAFFFFLPFRLYKYFGMEDLKRVIATLQFSIGDELEQRELIKKASVWVYLRFKVILSETSLWASLVERHFLGLLALSMKCLYFITSIAILVITHKMFKFGSFLEYGLLWRGERPDNRGKYLQILIQDKLFPKVAACEIIRWGASGLEEEQGMCILTPNILNQYIFLIFWFCLMLTILQNLVSIMFFLIKCVSPDISYKVFVHKTLVQNDAKFKKIYFNVGTSGRLVLEVIGTNLDTKVFEELMDQVYEMISDQLPNNAVEKKYLETHIPLLQRPEHKKDNVGNAIPGRTTREDSRPTSPVRQNTRQDYMPSQKQDYMPSQKQDYVTSQSVHSDSGRVNRGNVRPAMSVPMLKVNDELYIDG